jgi:hypothetical protein
MALFEKKIGYSGNSFLKYLVTLVFVYKNNIRQFSNFC